MTMDELYEATALARGNLDVSNVAKSLEETPQLVLRHVAREPPDEDSGVVRVRELVHLAGCVIAELVAIDSRAAELHLLLLEASASAHHVGLVLLMTKATTTTGVRSRATP
jgi:hypothetical protein